MNAHPREENYNRVQSLSEQLTSAFYDWEQRIRGHIVFSGPIDLEPDFVPFTFHIPERKAIIDDGRRPSIVSSIVDGFKSIFSQPAQPEPVEETAIEAFPYVIEHPFKALSIAFPKGSAISVYDAENFLLMLASCRHPVSFEIIAQHHKITVQYVCSEPDIPHLKNQLKAYFPLAVISEEEDALIDMLFDVMAITDFGLAEEGMRPLAVSKSFDPDPYISLFGVLENLSEGQSGGVQILFKGCVNPWSGSLLRSVTAADGKSFFEDAPEMVAYAEQKVSAPLFAAVIRVLGCSDEPYAAERIAESIGTALSHLSRSPGNMLVPLSNEGYEILEHLKDVIIRQTHRVGMLLNSSELATLAHFPSGSVFSQKLKRETKKTKKAPSICIGNTLVLGTNVHQDKEIEVSLRNAQRLKHMHVIGATGTGKSTLLLSMIVQDIRQGTGICVLDPHGDLIESILSYIPAERMHDVVVIDPADEHHPVGFNILSAHTDLEKNQLSSDLVAAFRKHSTSWGDQMNSVFANAVLAFLESSVGGTLADLRRFLIEKPFRDTFLETVTDPNTIYYWRHEYPLLKSSSIGSILTRLDSFLRPKLIRNMVCQKKSIDFDTLMDTNKIILVKLSQGLIGEENSYLLGTTIVSKLHQGAMARQAKAKEERSDFFVYIDEFQHFVTPSMASILSGARKYHLGLVLAHQDLAQLQKEDTELASSVLANAGTRICFRVGDADAKKLEQGFSFFEAADLQNLLTGEAIMRVEKPEFDFSLNTVPLPPSEIPALVKDHIIAASRKKYGTPKEIVEAALAEAIQATPSGESPIQGKVGGTGISVIKPREPEPKPTLQYQKEEPARKEVTESPAVQEFVEKAEERQHVMLANRIKKMAEDRGFIATIEAPTPDGSGFVDVSIIGNNRKIACEVSVTTTPTWELHNVSKCFAAGYDTVIVCAPDTKHREKIRHAIVEHIPEALRGQVFVFDPDALFKYLNEQIAESRQTEKIVKGRRVKTNYTVQSDIEAKQKEEAIKRILRKGG